MRYFDKDEAELLNAEPWQIEMLELNPSYICWGPHEDYMWKEGGAWDSRQVFASWAEFGPWRLDELNECVNFYFSAHRPNVECPSCNGSGLHPQSLGVHGTFYPHQCDELGVSRSQAWHDNITQDEAQALIDAKRNRGRTTAEEINAVNRGRSSLDMHDAINRHILIEARCKRLGLPVQCDECSGHGRVFTSEKAQLSLTLWWLHPRKGCSRGLEITNVERAELPAVREFLKQAAERNAQRFAKIVAGAA